MIMSAITSPLISPVIGLKSVVIAPLLTDTKESVRYGELQQMAGAIEASITPDNKDPSVTYADDGEFDAQYADPELTFRLQMADLPLTIQEMLLSNCIDHNGVSVHKSTDKPPYYAVGFKSRKADGHFRYVWLYKVRAKLTTETHGTKQGSNMNRQPREVEFVAIKRTYDGRYNAVADEGEAGFTVKKGSTFLDSVYEPAITPDPADFPRGRINKTLLDACRAA